jgi:outer membrane receptor for ferrienterochelin and colicin
MMKKIMIHKKLVATVFMALSGVILTFATGTIEGRITDSEGTPLPFASIVITHEIQNGQEVPLGSQIGTVTDAQGYYALTGVREGTFKVEAIYLGYQSKVVTVEVSDDESVTSDVALDNKTVDLEEVIVTTQARGQMAAINDQLSSIAIKNVVATDRIQRNPDANAAEAIGRLPGISVTRSGGEANDIVIRGMAPQYNTVMLNGIEIPSNKGTSRNASLGGVSQFSLQGIEVFKAITPDMDANTVSGAVNMQLKAAPNGFHGSIMAQGGYNNQNNDFSNYKLHGNISNRFLDNKLGFDLNINNERTNRSTESMGSNYAILTNDAPEGEMEPMFLNTVSLQAVQRINTRTSGSLVIDYRFSPRSKIEFSNFYSSSPTDQLVISKSHTPINESVGYGLNQNRGGHQRLYTGSLRGEHTLGIIQIDYSLAYSQSNL